MIHVTRTTIPGALEKNRWKWLKAYLKARQALAVLPTTATTAQKKAAQKQVDDAAKKYNHVQVRTALERMFAKKCVYCESHISHISYPQIEHYEPKAHFPHKCFRWTNLLLACGVCNGKQHKGDKFPDAAAGGPYINPTTENPEDYFSFEYNTITGTADVIGRNPRGITTERDLGLNRPDLVKHRSSVVEKMAYVASHAKAGNIDALHLLHRCCQPDEEYAAFARALVQRLALPHW